MASSLKNLSEYKEDNIPNSEKYKISIVVAEWNNDITFPMYEDCVKTLKKHHVQEDNIEVFQVPGSFELPITAKWILSNKSVDAIILLGCVIQGETKHDDYINHSIAQALQKLNLETGIPCIFGVLTTNNKQQAIDRSGGKHGNKGIESAVTALRMLAIKETLKTRENRISF